MLQEAILRPNTYARPIETRHLLKRQRPRRYRTSSPSLFFSNKAKALRTRFRTKALQLIYDRASNELGSSVASAEVSTWSAPEEDSSPILLLSVVANAGGDELRRVRKAILAAIAEESSSWSDEEKRDYSEKIYFELIPTDV